MRKIIMIVALLTSFPQVSFALYGCTNETNCGGGYTKCNSGDKKGQCHDASSNTWSEHGSKCGTACGAYSRVAPSSSGPAAGAAVTTKKKH